MEEMTRSETTIADEDEECRTLIDGFATVTQSSYPSSKKNQGQRRRGRILLLLLCLNILQFLLHLYRSFSVSPTDQSEKAIIISSNPVDVDDDGSNQNSAASTSTYPVYGLVHMAKTAGTEINGRLANQFERVCGNKGYSYDYFGINEALHEGKKAEMQPDTVQKAFGGIFSRGNRPQAAMDEIGYHDCDYISIEGPASLWANIAEQVGPIELHVPCREPIEHLLSQCNFLSKDFDCDAEDLVKEMAKCTHWDVRFSQQLFDSNANLSLACFNPFPPNGYVSAMSTRLQQKRMTTEYVHRASNEPRNKTNECLLHNPEVATKVRELLLGRNEYYQFCENCLGTEHDLLVDRN